MEHLHGAYHGDTVPERFASIVAPHLQSYNYFLTHGMANVVAGLEPFEASIKRLEAVHSLRAWFENIRFHKPKGTSGEKLWPSECRQSGTSYRGAITADLMVSVEGAPSLKAEVRLGSLPVMVRSAACWTAGLSRAALLRQKEEANEMGGYFICNGIERIIRMVIMQKRHYVVGIRRASNARRYPTFTEFATTIRCVLPDEHGAVIKCYYEDQGTVKTGITIGNREAFIPTGLLLRALVDISERDVYAHLVAVAPAPAGEEEPSDFAVFASRRAEKLLRECHRQGVLTQQQAATRLGAQLREKLGAADDPASDGEIGARFLQRHLFLHLTNARDKFLLLVLMVQKLYALAAGQCAEDNVDALAHHEVLLAGPLMAKALRERLLDWGVDFARVLQRDASRNPDKCDLMSAKYLGQAANSVADVGSKLEYMINTGNLKVDMSTRRPDVPQQTGFTVVAERLNWFRYISHFRSVHRGAYFNDSRTSSVRKLLPEGWGFLCPVHTPDGAPCGLLNHLAASCQVITHPAHESDEAEEARAALELLLVRLGVEAATLEPPPPAPATLPVLVDGRVVGRVAASVAPRAVAALRRIKAAQLALEEGRDAVLTAVERALPSHTEIVLLPHSQGAPFACMALFTSTSRLMRPVRQAKGGALELVGPLEQVSLRIRCPDGGAVEGAVFSHEEIDPTAMLSIVASLTPYSDFNQSPRNMYQCQMGKQTMGSPVHSYPYRTDGKMYRLLMPQTPLARTRRYDSYHFDEFPNGTNAVVAVLAYTGYDMEDGMILNKASVDRGFAHATLYKTEMIDLRDKGSTTQRFQAEGGDARPFVKREAANLGLWQVPLPANVPSPADTAAHAHPNADRVGTDGLPHVGTVVHPGEVYYNAHDLETGKDKPGRLKGKEVGSVDQVTIVGRDGVGMDRANIKMRVNRNPIIGDKFSSRHGQKGVLSKLWPDADMPYSEATGMRPDLLINPNAFPSRMTIGMLIESLASKAGALTGEWVDATPFQTAGGSHEAPAEAFGRALEQAGFSKCGGETMVSGITGEVFAADVYVGCVYYQRLRHMVSDKFQVRATGAVDPVIMQPIKGRKVGGGIRFGEMERDSLLAHGAAYLLHDRLHSSSDYKPCYLCNACGSLLSPTWVPNVTPKGMEHMAGVGGASGRWECSLCRSGKYVEQIAIPAVFRFLVVELAAMNIKLSVFAEDPRIRRRG